MYQNRWISFIALLGFATTPTALADLSHCAEPLVFRDGVELAFDCSQSQTADASMDELQAYLGYGSPVGFCVPEYQGDIWSICSESCGAGTGCAGGFEASELVINPTEDLICGLFLVEVPRVDVHYLTTQCTVSVTGEVALNAQLESTYTGPLTWEVLEITPELTISNVELSGCAGIAAVIYPILQGLLDTYVEEQMLDILLTIRGTGFCPVDSLRTDLIMP